MSRKISDGISNDVYKNNYHNSKSLHIHKAVCVATAVVISFTGILLNGCGIPGIARRSDNNSTYITDYSYNSDDNEDFNEYIDGLFRDLASQDTLTLHTLLEHPSDYGIDDYDITLGRTDIDTLDDTSDITQCITELEAFDRASLSRKQTVTYDYLMSYLNTRLCYSDLDIYGTDLTPTIGIQIQLPLIFSEYSFIERKDIDEYLELVADVKGYCDNLIEYEKLRAAKGYTLEDSLLNEVINSCESVVSSINQSETSGNRLFIDDFNSRIDGLDFLSEDDRNNYKKRNLDVVHESVIPGYQILIDGLTSILGTNRYSGGLCNYPDGQRYYEGILEQTLGWNKSVDEYYSLLENYMRNYMVVMRKLLQKDSSLIDKFSSYKFSLTAPADIIEDLKKRITDDYPLLDDVDYNIKYVSDALTDYASPAMYFMPQIDNPDINSIYINSAGTDNSDLYPTLAHEGYPGHLYQTQYFLKCNPCSLRSIIKPGGYVEGWASYVEVHSYEYNDNSYELNTLAQCNYATILCLHACGDIGVNYYGWDEARLSSFLSNWGFDSPDTAHSMYTALIANPGNYCKYVLGFIGFEELKKQAIKDLGDDFSLKEFHRYILETGPVQFDILFSNLKEWENSLVVVSSRAA